MSAGGSITVAAWVYLTDKSIDRVIAAKWGTTASNREWALLYQSSSDRIRFAGVHTTSTVVALNATSFGSPPLNTWLYVVAWMDDANNVVGLSVNGTEDMVALAGTPINSDRPLTIGGEPTAFSSAYMHGMVDEFSFWKRAISSEEREALYNSGDGLEWPWDTSDSITITTPSAYQVFQRSGRKGSIRVSGTYIGEPEAIEARFNGGAWAVIDSSPEDGTFTGLLTGQPQGAGTVEVRFSNDTEVTASVSNVGIGEVFICGGQSNMSGRATNSQTGNPSPFAGLYGNDGAWKQLADPYDDDAGQVHAVSADTAAAGSVIPVLAELLCDELNVPVAFVPCAKGGTAIDLWQPDADDVRDTSTLYGSMLVRLEAVSDDLGTHRPRFILWWQGESDVADGTSQSEYNTALDTIADSLAEDVPGTKLIVAKFQDGLGDETAVWAAIEEAWADNENVLQGPDLSDMVPDDDYHLMTDQKIAEAASRWSAAIMAVITNSGVVSGVTAAARRFRLLVPFVR